MYKVYIENNVLVFAAPSETVPTAERFVPQPGERLTLTKLLQKVQNTKRLNIISSEIETVFGEFIGAQPFIEAAGGIVRDHRGWILMILRNGRWDLPKGKLEPGERIEECAVREVGEECSLETDMIRRGELLAHTYHGYRIASQWVLKRTSWYRMEYTGRTDPAPQTEEGIVSAEWVPQEKIAERLHNAYHTIRDVFSAAGY